MSLSRVDQLHHKLEFTKHGDAFLTFENLLVALILWLSLIVSVLGPFLGQTRRGFLLLDLFFKRCNGHGLYQGCSYSHTFSGTNILIELVICLT